MKIARIQATPLHVPVAVAAGGGTRSSSLSLCLVDIETDTGLAGTGMTAITEEEVIAAIVDQVGVSATLGKPVHALDNPAMPLISSFDGILIYMYWLDNRQHHLPHVHAMYAGDEAVFAIESGDVIDGELPRRQTRLVQAWIELRRDALMADWSLAIGGRPISPVDPLK